MPGPKDKICNFCHKCVHFSAVCRSAARVQRKPHIPDITSVRREDRRNKARQKEDFDSHHGARPLPPLQPGDKVWVPGRESESEVKREVAPPPRSYEIETEKETSAGTDKTSSTSRLRRDLSRKAQSRTRQTPCPWPQQPKQAITNRVPQRSYAGARATQDLQNVWTRAGDAN